MEEEKKFSFTLNSVITQNHACIYLIAQIV